MHFRADHVQPAQFLDAFSQLDIGTPACHVGGDGHLVRLPGSGDDIGFDFHMVRVENLVFDLPLGQHLRDDFRLVDRPGADQQGPPCRVDFADLVHYGLPLPLLVSEHA